EPEEEPEQRDDLRVLRVAADEAVHGRLLERVDLAGPHGHEILEEPGDPGPVARRDPELHRRLREESRRAPPRRRQREVHSHAAEDADRLATEELEPRTDPEAVLDVTERPRVSAREHVGPHVHVEALLLV